MSKQLREALEVLGIPADSDYERATHAYRRLARVTHPDRSAAPDAAERFATVAAAYRLVSGSFVPAQSDEGMAASAPGDLSPRRHRGGRGTLSGHVWTATPDRAWSDWPSQVSPYLRTGLWDRSSIVAGPVMVRQAPDDVGVSAE